MSQQINLFSPFFREQGFSYTSATAMLYGVGIAAALAALVAVYQNYQLPEVERQAQATAHALKETSAQHDKMTVELDQRKPNAQLAAEVAALDAQLKGRQEIIETLKSGGVGNTDGFSDYMRAFSRQSISGLWLTGFDIALAGNELAIQGRTLSADLVASYLTRLNQEPAMRGRQFAALRIDQPDPAAQSRADAEHKAGKDAQGQKDAKDRKPATPRYLEFTISTSDLAESSRQKVDRVAIPAPLLGAIDSATMLGAAKANAGQGGVR